MDIELMIRKLFELTEMAYWKNGNHCGGDFDKNLCYGADNGSCPDYSFCKAATEFEKLLEA